MHWMAFAAVAALNIVTPGPTNLLMMNTGARFGRSQVIAFAMGNVLGLGLIGILITAGLTQFIVRSAEMMQILRFAGGVYLMWLGIKLCLSGPDEEPVQGDIPRRHAFRRAFFNAITNPKPLFFFGTILPIFVPKSGAAFGSTALLVLTFMLISFLSLNIYGAIAMRGAGLLRQAKARKWFNRFSGAALIGYGGVLALRRT
ncbi:LysE family translocator [Dyella mobilis]|nr:LysE family translocator [Dyella mobilis]